jgi:carboxyl-terminal processing protease
MAWHLKRLRAAAFVATLLILPAMFGCIAGPEAENMADSASRRAEGVDVASGRESDSELDSSQALARFDSVFSSTASDPENSRQLKQFRDVYTRVRALYVHDVSDSELVDAAIDGIVKRNGAPEKIPADQLVETALDAMTIALDPHSAYLNSNELKDAELITTGEFGGVGIQVAEEDGKIKVIAPIEDTPADRAGLKPGDVITHVDGDPVSGMTLSEAVHAMRGAEGSQIRLRLEREGRSPFDVTITREVISIKPVRWTVYDDIGYVRIVSFNEKVRGDLETAMGDVTAKLGSSGRGVVLDLRNNPGGLFEQSLYVADAFLDSGVIVSIRGRDQRHVREFAARAGDLAGGLPMVVLINGGSASASEIVASALQENNRALIMGTPSFGKGSVQTVMRLPLEGALKLTTALYYGPSGQALQAEGVHPDIVLTGGEDGSSTTREASLPHALPSFGRGIARDQVQVAAAACPAINRDDNNDRELGCALSLLQSGSLDRFLATRHADAGR